MKFRTKNRVAVAAVFVSMLGIFLVPGLAQSANRPTISAAQQALDILKVQNVMSRHEYYHSAGKNMEELDAIWVKKTPDPTLTNPYGTWTGLDRLRSFYGQLNRDMQQKTMEELAKKYPEIKVGPESLGVGSWGMHTLTTPIIEVAGDGKTAKGFWYSPGMGLNISPDGTASGSWYFEKYGVDFVKEDGEWKIWHIQMFYDLVNPLEKGVSSVALAKSGPTEVAENRMFKDPRNMPDKPNPNPYKLFGPTTVPVIVRMPEPYYTFSETFAY